MMFEKEDCIESFQGEFRWLSNFWPCEVELDGILYPSTENAYQAAKTLDLEVRSFFVTCTPAKAKRKAKSLVIRDDWDMVKVNIMRDLISQKFTVHNELGKKLIDTFPREIIEGNTWNDTFWGVCNGVGKNILGRLLMQRREELVEMYDQA
jgi:ribA/ribD-fused uncharacterized protein